MDSNNASNQLQAAVLKEFIHTRHNRPNDPTYQSNQLQAILFHISEISKQHPDILTLLENGIQTVPTMHAVGDVDHMHNIGISANECLEMLTQNYDETKLAIYPIVKLFLQKVIEQAQDACKAHEANTGTIIVPNSPPNTHQLFQYYKDHLDALTEDANKRIKILRDETEAASKRAASEAEAAQAHAKSAEETAKKITKAAQASIKAFTGSVKNLNNATQSAKKATKAAEDAEEAAKSMLPNMLTVLSIFVSIIVAVVACYLSILLGRDGFADSAYYSRPLEIMYILIMGHITLGVIFFLLYLTSKMIHYSLACHCRDFCSDPQSPSDIPCDCSHCAYRCTFPLRVRLRYPYIFGINLIFFIAYMVLGLWQIVNLYYRDWLDALILQNRAIAAIIIVLLVIATFAALGFIFGRKRRVKVIDP